MLDIYVVTILLTLTALYVIVGNYFYPTCLYFTTINSRELLLGVTDAAYGSERDINSCSYKLGKSVYEKVNELPRPIVCEVSYLLFYDSTKYNDLFAFKFTGTRPSAFGITQLDSIHNRPPMRIKFVTEVRDCPIFVVHDR